MGRAEIIIGVFLTVLSLVFFALTYQFPAHTLAFSPKIFPRFVSVCLFVIASVLVIQGITAVRRSPPEDKAEHPLDKAFLTRLSVSLLIGYAYTRILQTVGYVAVTPLFIAGIMIVFNEKNWLKIVATSIITTGLLYVLFRIIFKIPLPRFSLL